MREKPTAHIKKHMEAEQKNVAYYINFIFWRTFLQLLFIFEILVIIF